LLFTFGVPEWLKSQAAEQDAQYPREEAYLLRILEKSEELSFQQEAKQTEPLTH